MAKKRRDKGRPKRRNAPKTKAAGKKLAGNLPRGMVDAPSVQLDAAQSLWQKGRHDDALDLYRDAIRREPNNLRGYTLIAQAYGQKFRFERMEEQLQKMVARAPNHPGVHHFSGETYGLQKLPAKAMACYERAAKLTGAQATTWLQLASQYERSHRLDEAEELIERSIHTGCDSPQVDLVRGRIQRRQKQSAQAEATFRALIQRMPETEWACQAWGEIALMKDRQGDYPGAVEAIGQCKQLQLAHDSAYWKASEKLLQKMEGQVEDISSDHLRRWRDEAAHFSPRRVGLLTGFPRSGTTLIEQVLDSHPDLISSEERDFVGGKLLHHYYAKQGAKPLVEVFDDLREEQIEPERSRYFQAMEYLLGEPIGDRLHLDKNPGYGLTLPLYLRVFPETRLIVALRDPRDVVLSCYLRYLPFNMVSVRFLTPERTAERYAMEMRMWLKMRDLIDNPWCEIRYEDTIQDLAGQARKGLETLGLDWNPQVLEYRDRLTEQTQAGQKQVNSPSYEAVAEPLYSRAIGRWKNYQELLEPTFAILAPFIREFGYEER